jgi:predicted esterase
MKSIFILLFLVLAINLFGQYSAEDHGYTYKTINFQGDSVHILVKSKKGESLIRKPIIFEVQGSLPYPLIVHNGKRMVRYPTLTEGFIEEDYHLVFVSKPGIPLICHQDSVSKRGYKDPSTGTYPINYIERNHLDYYVSRNHSVLEFIKKQSWVDTSLIIIAGHSEGSTIATHMADKIEGITHLIYSGGLPYYSRILAMIQQERMMEKGEENPWVKKTYDYWEEVIAQPFDSESKEGWNSYKGTYSFSQSENEVLKRLRIPVLISYGTLDEASPFNDMFHIEVIRNKLKNFTFHAHVGADHYYQLTGGRDGNSSPEDILSKVVNGWLLWIKGQ